MKRKLSTGIEEYLKMLDSDQDVLGVQICTNQIVESGIGQRVIDYLSREASRRLRPFSLSEQECEFLVLTEKDSDDESSIDSHLEVWYFENKQVLSQSFYLERRNFGEYDDIPLTDDQYTTLESLTGYKIL